MYLSDDFEAKVRDDLCFVNEELAESLFLEIPRAQGKNIVIGVIYRPPNQSVGDFLFAYKELIGKISEENQTCYIMGDFNFNLMDHHCEFLDGMYSNMFIPLITRPTRITSQTATLIDNIFTNQLSHCLRSGLLFTDISDHLPVFSICFEDKTYTRNVNDVIVFRDKNKQNVAKFDDPNISYKTFLSKYTEIYNLSFPLRKINANKSSISKPWSSKGL